MVSFREKSLWVSLLITAVIASAYGDDVYQHLFANQSIAPEDTAALITRIVIAFVILEIALHIALSMDDQEGAGLPEDERERNYRLLANDAGYWVLSIGVIACIIHQMTDNVFYVDPQATYSQVVTAPIEVKLIAIFWLSEVVRFATELYYFRKQG